MKFDGAVKGKIKISLFLAWMDIVLQMLIVLFFWCSQEILATQFRTMAVLYSLMCHCLRPVVRSPGFPTIDDSNISSKNVALLDLCCCEAVNHVVHLFSMLTCAWV